MHAQGARDPQLGAGGNWEALTSEYWSKFPIVLPFSCCRCLREGFHGGTSANTRSERVRFTCQETRKSFCGRDRRLVMCEMCGHMKRSLRSGPDPQSSIWLSAQLV